MGYSWDLFECESFTFGDSESLEILWTVEAFQYPFFIVGEWGFTLTGVLLCLLADRDMVKCAQSGFDEFVSKPLTIEKLLERLKKIQKDPVNNRVLDT